MKDKPVIAIVQARIGSKRLPGKVLLDLEGKPVLLRIIDRLLQSKKIDQIVVAATLAENDKAITEAVRSHYPDIPVYRGSENDLLDRWYHAVKQYNPLAVVKILSDCPLIDPLLVDKVIDAFLKDNADYAATAITQKTYPLGMDVEVFSFQVLERLFTEMKGEKEREYPSLFIREHQESFTCKEVSNEKDYSSYRLTLDEPADYELIKIIYHQLIPKNPYFTMEDIIDLLERNPELARINQHVEQKWKNY